MVLCSLQPKVTQNSVYLAALHSWKGFNHGPRVVMLDYLVSEELVMLSLPGTI